MLLETSSGKLALDDEAQLSYFVRKKGRKAPRVGYAKLIDITEAGLCMEISPVDSDLFMESKKTTFILSKDIELQIFCRSHPINVSVAGCIKWFKRKEEIHKAENSENIYVGLIFTFFDSAQKKEIAELVGHLKNDMVRCNACGASISADTVLCYSCGARHVRKRAFLKKMLFSLLANNENVECR